MVSDVLIQHVTSVDPYSYKYLHNRLNMVRKDLPAAFEVIKDRKALMEKSRKLLGLETGEKNVSVMRKVRCDLSFNSYS